MPPDGKSLRYACQVSVDSAQWRNTCWRTSSSSCRLSTSRRRLKQPSVSIRRQFQKIWFCRASPPKLNECGSTGSASYILHRFSLRLLATSHPQRLSIPDWPSHTSSHFISSCSCRCIISKCRKTVCVKNSKKYYFPPCGVKHQYGIIHTETTYQVNSDLCRIKERKVKNSLPLGYKAAMQKSSRKERKNSE